MRNKLIFAVTADKKQIAVAAVTGEVLSLDQKISDMVCKFGENLIARLVAVFAVLESEVPDVAENAGVIAEMAAFRKTAAQLLKMLKIICTRKRILVKQIP